MKKNRDIYSVEDWYERYRSGQITLKEYKTVYNQLIWKDRENGMASNNRRSGLIGRSRNSK